MSTYTYPIPDAPHPDWARLLAALWSHGLNNPDPEQVQTHLRNVALLESIAQTTERRDEAAMVRPSSLLSCARQAYLLLQGHKPEPMSMGLAPSFAIGHLAEAFTRAFLFSALPPCFELLYDRPVPLPSWWPDHEQFRQQGTNDFTIQVRPGMEAAARAFVDYGLPVCMFDCKTTGVPNIDKFARAKSLSDGPDGFGYNAQLTVYGAGNPEPCETALLVFNRNSPMKGVVVRALKAGERAEEEARLRVGLEKAVAGVDPGMEFKVRWGKSGDFYCNNYCSMRHACQSTPAPLGDQ